MHFRWPLRYTFPLAAICWLLAFASIASASSLPLTGPMGGTNMGPWTTGGYLASMQKCETTPPALPPSPYSSTGCGMYTMTDSQPASVRWSFSAPPSTGSVVASSYVYAGTRTGTLVLYVNGTQVGNSISIPAGARQWYNFPAINVSPSDTISMATIWAPGTRTFTETMHAEFTENTIGTLVHSDMTQDDEELPEGVPCSYDWSGCDSATPPHRGAITKLVGDPDNLHWPAPWGQVYNCKSGHNGCTGNPAPADRAEVRGLQQWILWRSTQQWTPLYTDNVAHPYYPNNPAIPSQYSATATASSAASSCQGAVRAIDGGTGGAPTYPCSEWVTYHEGAGAWLKLTWAQPVDISRVILLDRPNTSDQVTGGTLKFSDGSTVDVPALNNDGSATTVSFPSRTTSTLEFDVTSVSSTTSNVGLAEIEPIGPVMPKIGGALYHEDFSGSTLCAGLDYTGDPGSVMSTPNVDCNGNPVSGYLYHYFPGQGRAYISDTADVEAVAAMVQMRLAPTNPLNDGVNLVGNVGSDEWGCQYGCNTVDGVGESRFKRLEPGWRTFVYDNAPADAPLPPFNFNGQPIPADQLR